MDATMQDQGGVPKNTTNTVKRPVGKSGSIKDARSSQSSKFQIGSEEAQASTANLTTCNKLGKGIA